VPGQGRIEDVALSQRLTHKLVKPCIVVVLLWLQLCQNLAKFRVSLWIIYLLAVEVEQFKIVNPEQVRVNQ